MVQRVRPIARNLALLAGLLAAITSGAVREFVWADVKEGLVDLRGLSRPLRLLIRIGFLLLVLSLLVLILSDWIRIQSPLLVIGAGVTGRGTLVPTLLLPITLTLLAVAWSFMLAGSLHSHWIVRLVVFAFFLGMIGSWVLSSQLAASGIVEQLLGWSPLALLACFVLWRWFRPGRPLMEYLVLLVLVATTIGIGQIQLVGLWQRSGLPLFVSNLQSDMFSFAGLAMPLLLLIGLDIAEFTYVLSNWCSGIGREYLGRLGIAVGVVTLLAIAWYRMTMTAFTRFGEVASAAEVIVSYAGAIPVVLLVLGVWLATKRGGSLSEQMLIRSGRRCAPWFVLLFLGGGIVMQLVLVLGAAILGPIGLFTELVRVVQVWIVEQMRDWANYAFGIALFWALRAWQRTHYAVANYMGTLSLVMLWGVLTGVGYPLEFLLWEDTEVHFWWLLFVTSVGANWWFAGRLDDASAARLIVVLLMLLLIDQSGFVEDPFSPLFGFAGIGFVAFGLLWDAVTIGAWANQDTPRLPRVSRIFLYLGYVLFTVAVVNWMLSTHTLSYVESLTGDIAIGGFRILGKPLLYALIPLILFSTAPSRQSDDADACVNSRSAEHDLTPAVQPVADPPSS